MESLDSRCTALKTKYDECFNTWFRGSFLKGRGHHEDACGLLFAEYKACVKAALEREGLDSPDLFEDILGTNKEKKAKSNS